MSIKLKKHETLYSEEDLVGYVRYSGGAIEVHTDYVVFYKNFLPFSWNVYGRNRVLIKYEEIGGVEFRGCGWFIGHFAFAFKHFLRPKYFFFGKWFVPRRKKINKEIEPLFRYISERVLSLRRLAEGEAPSAAPRPVVRPTPVETPKAPVCPKCGASIDDDMMFCGECGAKLK